jgi:hypothetical protein
MAAVPNAAQVAQVLRTAAHLHRAGNLTVTAAIIIAAGRHYPDYAEADTFADAAVSFLAGQWEAASTRETVAMMFRLAADEANRLFSIIDAASEAVPSPLAQAEKAVSETTAAAEPSPLELVEAAKRRRDFPGEIAAVQAGQRALETAPWYPALAGDLVHVHYYGSLADMTLEQGETYVVERSEDEGGLVLRLLHHTAGFEGAGCFAPGMVDAPLMEAWFEAGPDALTIVRDGRVVHGGTR